MQSQALRQPRNSPLEGNGLPHPLPAAPVPAKNSIDRKEWPIRGLQKSIASLFNLAVEADYSCTQDRTFPIGSTRGSVDTVLFEPSPDVWRV